MDATLSHAMDKQAWQRTNIGTSMSSEGKKKGRDKYDWCYSSRKYLFCTLFLLHHERHLTTCGEIFSGVQLLLIYPEWFFQHQAINGGGGVLIFCMKKGTIILYGTNKTNNGWFCIFFNFKYRQIFQNSFLYMMDSKEVMKGG